MESDSINSRGTGNGRSVKLASKAKRINITLPERVLALVDEQAKREGESRSGLLARAALDYIGRNKVA